MGYRRAAKLGRGSLLIRIRGGAFYPVGRLLLIVSIITIAMANSAHAIDYTQDLNDFIALELKPLVSSDIVIDNLLKYNEEHANLAESNLRVLDNNWRSELRKTNQTLVESVLRNDLADFLRKAQSNLPVYTQLTIIDNKGLNISQTVVGESYWNVGRPRWDKTFAVKSYAPYISEVYYSDETNKFQAEVSFMIIADEQPVGVVVAGIDVEQLEDWKKSRN